MKDVLMVIGAFFGGVLAMVVADRLSGFRAWEVARVLVASELGENVIKAAGLLSGRLPVDDPRGLYATEAWSAHRASFVGRMAVIDTDSFAILCGIYARLESLNRSGEPPEEEFLFIMEGARSRLWGYRAGRLRTLYLRLRTYRARKRAGPIPDWRPTIGFPGHGTASVRQEQPEQPPPERAPGASEGSG